MKVLKFGGSSVANARNIKNVIEIISDTAQQTPRLAVVVSALGGVTDQLIQLAFRASQRDQEYPAKLQQLFLQHNHAVQELLPSGKRLEILSALEKQYERLGQLLEGIFLLQELSARSLDAVMSFGEHFSAYIISQALCHHQLDAHFADATQFVVTDDHFGNANVDIRESYERIGKYFGEHSGILVMGGFIASSYQGIPTTLGRGGSDYTASLVGAALKVEAIEIWTDVDGVMTVDPRQAPGAFALREISYEEAGELAHFGAKVIHPKTMKPARLEQIPIDIKNTFHPEKPGTRIKQNTQKPDFPITGISSLDDIALIRIQTNNGNTIGETATRLFNVLSRHHIDVLLTTQASHEQAISLGLHRRQVKVAQMAIEKHFALEIQAGHMQPLDVEKKLSIIAIVGKHMKGVPGISGKLFQTLGQNRINVIAIAQGSSELNISIVISAQESSRATQVIHEAFFQQKSAVSPTPRVEPVQVFLLGTGLIASALLQQMNEAQQPVRLCGLANSRQMVLAQEGIAVAKWSETLAKGQRADLQGFIAKMKQFKLARTVFVDCTASSQVVEAYPEILGAGIGIVTPNKKANSGSFQQYQKLQNLSQHHHAPFLYETTVGAGLPIIRSLRNLVETGDKIHSIEAVLSGTLSYIFNTFSQQDVAFSQIVKQAQEKGYTEPDPREDLNGRDVARKLLILARESGSNLEMEDIVITPLLPEDCFLGDVSAFYQKLVAYDAHFHEKKMVAREKGCVLRLIASLDQGKARIALEEVAASHPAYHLTHNDNIVCFTSKRYWQTPLVIQGPGAGAEVTAAGVLADILSIF